VRAARLTYKFVPESRSQADKRELAALAPRAPGAPDYFEAVVMT